MIDQKDGHLLNPSFFIFDDYFHPLFLTYKNKQKFNKHIQKQTNIMYTKTNNKNMEGQNGKKFMES